MIIARISNPIISLKFNFHYIKKPKLCIVSYMTFQDMQKLAVILCPENNIFVLVVISV